MDKPKPATGLADIYSKSNQIKIDPVAAAARAAFVRSKHAAGGMGALILKQSVYGYEEQLIGHHYTWVNDTPGNIQYFRRRGYSHVLKEDTGKVGDLAENLNNDLGNCVSMIVGKDHSGQPMKGFLMKIPQEWYDEDQKAFIEEGNKYDDMFRGNKLLETEENMPDGVELRIQRRQYSNGNYVYR